MAGSGYYQPFAPDIAVLALAVLLTVPAIIAVYAHLCHKKMRPALYKDKDGVATQESMAAFSAKTPKIVLTIFSSAGFGIAVALAVLTTVSRVDNLSLVQHWLNVAQWVNFICLSRENTREILRNVLILTGSYRRPFWYRQSPLIS